MLRNFKKIVLILIFVPLFSFGTESNIIKHELDIVNQEDEKKYPCYEPIPSGGRKFYNCTLEEFNVQQDEHQKLINKSEQMAKEHMQKQEFEDSLPKIEVDENGFIKPYAYIDTEQVDWDSDLLTKDDEIGRQYWEIQYTKSIYLDTPLLLYGLIKEEIKSIEFPLTDERFESLVFDEIDIYSKTDNAVNIMFTSTKNPTHYGSAIFYKNGKFLEMSISLGSSNRVYMRIKNNYGYIFKEDLSGVDFYD